MPTTSHAAHACARLREWDAEHAAAATPEARLLRRYQLRIVRALAGPGRGLLVDLGMGMGKSVVAAAALLAARRAAPRRRVVLYMPRGLHANMAAAVRRVAAALGEPAAGEALLADALRVNSDAHNAADRLWAAAAPASAGDRAARGAEPDGRVLRSALDGAVVVVDEAHLLFGAVVNGGANARRFYEQAMAARGVKLIFLTGTPLQKDPFEMVPCFNMLAGRELLPTRYDRFWTLYVDPDGRRVRNAGALANRLVGLAAAPAPGGDGRAPGDAGWYPRTSPVRVVRVPMSAAQYAAYRAAAAAEAAERGGPGGPRRPRAAGYREAPKLALPGAGAGAGTYHVGTRMVSLFAPPDDFEDRGGDVAALPDAAFGRDACPKLWAFADLLAELQARTPGVVALAYSQFVDRGLKALARVLAIRGMTPWVPPAAPARRPTAAPADAAAPDAAATPDAGPDAAAAPDAGPADAATPDAGPDAVAADLAAVRGDALADFLEPPIEGGAPDTMSSPGSTPKDLEGRFALYAGEVPPADREALVAAATAPENARGVAVRVVLLSAAGAQGLDLKHARLEVALEPYWSRARTDQFFARSVRIGSHDALPPEDRDCERVVLVAVAPDGAAEEPDAATPRSRSERTIDEEFLARGEERAALVAAFRDVIASVALESSCGDPAGANGAAARVCEPTGRPLYGADPFADAAAPDPCLPARRAAARRVEVGGRRYALGADGRAFAFSEALGAYTPLDPSDPLVPAIVAAAEAGPASNPEPVPEPGPALAPEPAPALAPAATGGAERPFPYSRGFMPPFDEMARRLLDLIRRDAFDVAAAPGYLSVLQRSYPDDYRLADSISDWEAEPARVACRERDHPSPLRAWEAMRGRVPAGLGDAEARELVYAEARGCNLFNVAFGCYLLRHYGPDSSGLVSSGLDIVDPCAGWGDRLGAAFLTGAASYRGWDTNEELQPVYAALAARYEKALGGERAKLAWSVECAPFEDARLSPASADVFIASPPFFDQELYRAAGGRTSTDVYPDEDAWYAKFYARMWRSAAEVLRPGGRVIAYVAPGRMRREAGATLERQGLAYVGAVGLRVGTGKIRGAYIWEKPRAAAGPEVEVALLDLADASRVQLEALAAIGSQPEVYRRLGPGKPWGPGRFEELARQSAADRRDPEAAEREAGVYRHYAVLLGGRAVGYAGLRPVEGSPSELQMRLFIDPALQGRGLGAAAARALAGVARGLGKTPVSFVDPSNAASARSHEKAGFRRVGEKKLAGTTLVKYVGSDAGSDAESESGTEPGAKTGGRPWRDGRRDGRRDDRRDERRGPAELPAPNTPGGLFIDPGYNEAERAAVLELVGQARPCLPTWMDECPRAGAATAVAYRPRKRGPDNIRGVTNLHHGQRKLFLSELQCLTALLPRADSPAVMVYAGAAPGDHLHYLAELFPGLTIHAVDPAPFRVKGPPDARRRVVLRREFFTDAVAREYSASAGGAKPRCADGCEVARRPDGYAGRCAGCPGGLEGGAAGEPICDVCRNALSCRRCGRAPRADIFVSDIRIGVPTGEAAWSPEFEAQVAEDMAAQARWTRLADPRLGAMLKFRPPYIDAGERLTLRYLAGRVLTQTWPSTSSTETRLVARRSLEGEPYPDDDWDVAEYQDWCAHHNVCRRSWAFYGAPAEFVRRVPGYDGCFDCANEAAAWAAYCRAAGEDAAYAPALMARLTAEIGQRLDRPRGSFHGWDARPMAAKRAELWARRGEIAEKGRYRGSEASKSDTVRRQD